MTGPTVSLSVDGQALTVAEGVNLLQALQAHGFRIPSLCFHPALKHPIGTCRLCVVELSFADSIPHLRRACLAKTSDGLIVQTQGPEVALAREKAMRALLEQAPQADRLYRIAEEFNIPVSPPPDGCIRCRLCEQVCREVVGAAALRMAKRGGRSLIVPVEGRCIGCGTCANVCPTRAIAVTDDETVRTISIRGETIGRHPLALCEGCGKRFATMKFLDITHERTHDHPDVKEHHRWCPDCAKRLAPRVSAASTRRY